MIKQYKITVNGKVYDVEVEEVSQLNKTEVLKPVPPKVEKAPVQIEKPVEKPKEVVSSSSSSSDVIAHIPGIILSINVSVGDNVQEGQVVAILEAMKMENEIIAPVSGTIQSILVEKGASVVDGQVLIKIG